MQPRESEFIRLSNVVSKPVPRQSSGSGLKASRPSKQNKPARPPAQEKENQEDSIGLLTARITKAVSSLQRTCQGRPSRRLLLP